MRSTHEIEHGIDRMSPVPLPASAPPPPRSVWPARDDPRLAVAAILFTYVVVGIAVLGFNRAPEQVAITVLTAVGLDMLLHRWLRGGPPQVPPLVPLSALITGLGLSILVNYAHGLWLAAVPPAFAIASKYLFTFRGRHVYNPALFGVVACLLLGGGMISDSPAYQWGGSYAVVMFVVTFGLYLFVLRIRRVALIVSFLVFYTLALLLRAWLTRWHMPMETWLLGALSSPALYLFTFFMVTDPQTSPPGRKAQVLLALAIVVVDLALHLKESLSTLFYAAFFCATLRFAWSHGRAFLTEARQRRERFGFGARRTAWVGGAALLAWLGVQGFVVADEGDAPPFTFVAVDSRAAGVAATPGRVLQEVDPRIAHIAKWLLSVGDAVAVADVDNDGLQDVFLTYPLKDADSRAGLYKNLGDFRFERIEVPALRALFADPKANGLPSGAVFYDYDNDGDADLLVLVGYGRTRLFRNRLVEDGRVAFEDVSDEVGLTGYTVSVAAGVADFDHDGRLDLAIGNALNPVLSDYPTPTRLNVFALPQAQAPGDRRMFDFMHRTWHDANNGGGAGIFLNRGGRYAPLAVEALDLVGEHRWTNSIGVGDLNGDGWPDIYLANDFGPDQLLVNRGDGTFKRVRGRIVGSIGRDTYKGMNVSIADFDNDGKPGIYVSNVHEKLQAEGSLLWQRAGDAASTGTADGWADRAMQRGLLNENRFGWGAAAGDLDLDGRLDVLQANGMVDDAYDRGAEPGCPDYWYWNDKIALTRPDVHGYADRWADLRGRCIFPAELDRVYLNRGRHFVDVAARVGWTAPGNSRGVALVDLDNDGDLDVVVTHQFAPATIWRNVRKPDRPAATWVGLQLVGDGRRCNRDAIGSQVTIAYRHGDETRTQTREVVAVNGFSAQGDRRLLFGLDGAREPVEARVRWCGAKEAEVAAQTVTLEVGRYRRLVQSP